MSESVAAFMEEIEALCEGAVYVGFTETCEDDGTLAAMLAMSAPGEEPRRVTLVVDRPFFFLIRDPETGAIVFLARVVEPPEPDSQAVRQRLPRRIY